MTGVGDGRVGVSDLCGDGRKRARAWKVWGVGKGGLRSVWGVGSEE